MAFKKAQKITLADLNSATKEYEALIKQTEKTYAEWDSQKDKAFSSITQVETLAESISHAPFTIGRKLKKLAVQKEDYKGKETIEREKRKNDLIAGAGALAVFGAGAAAAISFWDYVVAFVSKRTGGKLEKNYVVWLVVAMLVLIAGIFLLIGWAFNRWRTAKKAEKSTKKLRKSIAELKRKEAKAAELTTSLSMQCDVVEQYMDALAQYSRMPYKALPKDVQKDLILMVDEAILLSELMNNEAN